jgi:hypothetical protein
VEGEQGSSSDFGGPALDLEDRLRDALPIDRCARKPELVGDVRQQGCCIGRGENSGWVPNSRPESLLSVHRVSQFLCEQAHRTKAYHFIREAKHVLSNCWGRLVRPAPSPRFWGAGHKSAERGLLAPVKVLDVLG